MQIGEVVVEGNATRIAFSVKQQIERSCWGERVIDMKSLAAGPHNLVVDDGTGEPAYFAVMLFKDGFPRGIKPQGTVNLIVKTCFDGDWDNAWDVMSSGPVDMSFVNNGDLAYMAAFANGNYGNLLRLYYQVEGELSYCKFYAYITNQRSINERLSFVAG